MLGHVLLQISSETDSNELQQLSGTICPIAAHLTSEVPNRSPSVEKPRSNSDLAFLGHGVSEDQHTVLEALKRKSPGHPTLVSGPLPALP